MSFPRYPKYKPSGVECLGDVPEGWGVEPFKRQIARNDGGVWGDDPDGISDTIVLRSTEQTVDGRWQLDDPASRKLASSEIEGALLVEGDLLLTKSSGSSLHIGKTTLVTAEIAEMRCCYSNFMQRIRMKATFLPRLAWYVLNNELARRQLDLMSNSTTGLANLNATMVGELVVIVPPLAEQTAIAEFLDRETRKIDELVAEQWRLMELLKEKRQAIISNAVTKGLNPQAPTKPSGIEWLGEVPKHWQAGPLKRHIAKVESGTSVNSSDEPAEDGKLGVLKTSCVYRGYFDPTENKTVVLNDIDRVSCLVKAGTLIVSRMNTPELIGAAGLVASAPPNLYLPDRLWQISFSDVDVRFVHFWTLTSFYRAQVESACTGTSPSMKNLGQDQFGCFAIAMPPKDEQFAIASFLDREAAKFDTLTAEAQRAIDLLQERRTALISAAVTGQIDVRNQPQD